VARRASAPEFPHLGRLLLETLLSLRGIADPERQVLPTLKPKLPQEQLTGGGPRVSWKKAARRAFEDLARRGFVQRADYGQWSITEQGRDWLAQQPGHSDPLLPVPLAVDAGNSDLWAQIRGLAGDVLSFLGKEGSFEIEQVGNDDLTVYVLDNDKQWPVPRAVIEAGWRRLTDDGRLSFESSTLSLLMTFHAYVLPILAALPGVTVVSRAPVELAYGVPTHPPAIYPIRAERVQTPPTRPIVQTQPKETSVSKLLFSQYYLQQRLAEKPEWLDLYGR
jgi:hypothetical protein